ncbi:MAG: RHS repeat-associated core domain-containing protein [Hahellaceae bacterium]|nr:RHS repeat-associated core domain-containing protein [Hahellaceae bacterium]MCP5210319.1 RHS repeat-associated core domain-containing protein [Hahellaceae bacterium]
MEKIETLNKSQTLQNLTYTYDNLGNVYKRTSEVRGLNLTEGFSYDNLNRLTQAATSGLSTGTRILNYQYDKLGNITFKTGVSDTNGYKYENGRPHAVSSIVLNGQTTSFTYDANGNMRSDGNRTLTYNSIGKPVTISQGNAEIHFKYGPDGNRFYQEKFINNTLVQKTYYLAGGAYEEIVDFGKNVVKRKSYVNGLMLHINSKPYIGGFGKNTLQFMHNDALGSTDMISDLSGKEIERMAFDPFGARRQDQWQDPNATFESLIADMDFDFTSRGFTGHEHLDDFGLIHMNGRVYDPVIGRFLTPDPLIQAPHFSQSYNRYSYVWNNPLSMVDPSGYAGSYIDTADWGLSPTWNLEQAQAQVDRNAGFSYVDLYTTSYQGTIVPRVSVDYEGVAQIQQKVCEGICHGTQPSFINSSREVDSHLQNTAIKTAGAVALGTAT